MDRDRRSPGPAGADGAEGEGQNRNGAPEWEQSLPVEHGRLEADVSDFQRQTRVEAGDEVLLLVEAVDSLGRTCTRQVEGAAFSDGPSGLEWAAFP